MKRLLLGTTALIGAGLISHGAQAADQPVKLSISGYLQAGYGFVAGDTGTTANKNLPDAVQEWGVIDFSGDTTFANGYGAGVFVEFYDFGFSDAATGNGGSGTSATQQAWVHITNPAFGEIRIGDQSDAVRAKEVIAPEFASDDLFSANSPDIFITHDGTNTTQAFIGNKYSGSVGYYSPVFSGFQLAVTYAPDAGRAGHYDSPPSTYNTNNAYSSYSHKWAAAATWGGTVGGVTIAATGGVSGATTKQNELPVGFSANPIIYNFGASAAIGPWTVGADYEQTNNLLGLIGFGTTIPGAIGKVGDAGVTYVVGPWTVGSEISYGQYKLGAFGFGTDVKPALTTALAGGTYNLGPGVNLSAAVGFTDFDNGGNAAFTGIPGYDSVQVLVGTDIHF